MLVVLVVIVVTLFGRPILKFLASFWIKTYKAERADAEIDFQSVADISLYVPQFKVDSLNYPVLACYIDDLNTKWVGWSDPADPSYDKHNLIFDIPHDRMKPKRSETADEARRKVSPLFSIVKSWSRTQEQAKAQ